MDAEKFQKKGFKVFKAPYMAYDHCSLNGNHYNGDKGCLLQGKVPLTGIITMVIKDAYYRERFP